MTYLQIFYFSIKHYTIANTRADVSRLLGQLICYILVFVTLFACSSRKSPAPVVSVYGSAPLKDRVKTSIKGSEYKVKAGETLYSIAWRANSDVRQIAQLNKLSPPYNIYPNQKLILVPSVKVKVKGKTTKASHTKHPSKKQNKSSSHTSAKGAKKTLASTKKQAYGKNINTKKTVRNDLSKDLPKTTFSQKISHWQWPVKGKVITRFSSKKQGNKGIDITGQRGTKIRAAAAGKVVYAGSALRGYGKLIIIKHNDDYLSAYAHNDTILVKELQYVKAGDIVAKMGDTAAQRVMLHFEVRFRGNSVDPLKYLPKK